MKALDDPKDWIPLKEVAHTLRVSRHTVIRLCEEVDPISRKPYLRSWRVTPGTLLVSRVSLEEHCAATQGDSEYWSGRRPRGPNAAFRWGHRTKLQVQGKPGPSNAATHAIGRTRT
jgi:hypothetical protein